MFPVTECYKSTEGTRESWITDTLKAIKHIIEAYGLSHGPCIKKLCTALYGNTSQSYGAIRSHSITCHQTHVNTPALTPASQAGT